MLLRLPRLRAVGQQQKPDGAEYIHVIHDEPRHPDALSAILVTGVHFGGITGPKASTGLNELAIEQLGNRFGQRTGFGAAKIRALPNTTDAPERLKKVPDRPRNDDIAMRANMPKMSTKAHGSKRKKVICFDLQGPFKPSSSGYRYCVNFYCIDHATHLHREIRHWHVDFLRSKDEFPDRLEDFLNSGESESGW